MSTKKLMFALAPTIADGYRGAFCEGPVASFDTSWMSGPEIPFILGLGDEPQLATIDMLILVNRMGKDLFKALSDEVLSMYHEAAQGRDCTPRFDERLGNLNTILDRCPWTLHPDHGCVRHADVPELDEAAERPTA